MIFVFLFAKSERDNIDEQERAALAEIGGEYLRLPERELDELVANGVLIEVHNAES